jgi:antitoxin (DNA-binding transcriptional repressor) of toxin-antitoxin stability system
MSEPKIRTYPIRKFREDIARCIEFVRGGGELIITQHKKPAVRVIPLASGDLLVVSALPELDLDADLPLPEESHTAHRRHPAVVRGVLVALSRMDELTAAELLAFAEELLAGKATRRPAAPPARQLPLPAPLRLVPKPEEEEGMQFPKPVSKKPPQATPVGCECEAPQVGALVGRHQVTIHKDGDVIIWAGEPGEARALSCRDCGWALTITRRPFGEGYKVERPRAAKRPRLLLVEELSES